MEDHSKQAAHYARELLEAQAASEFDAKVIADLASVMTARIERGTATFSDKITLKLCTALQAAQAAEGAVSGFRLVPIEPTREMLQADATQFTVGTGLGYEDNRRLMWRAMLAAAPTPQAESAHPSASDAPAGDGGVFKNKLAWATLIDEHKSHDGSVDSFELAESIIDSLAAATLTDATAERTAFEAWYAQRVSAPIADIVALRRGDGYTLTAPYLQSLWTCWQSRAALSRPSEAAGEQDWHARIRKWRDAFDAMHRRAMKAEAALSAGSEAAAGEPIYQIKTEGVFGRWDDVSKDRYDQCVTHGDPTRARVVYTHPASEPRFYKHIDAEGNPYWLHTPPASESKALTDEHIDALWVMRGDIHNGELMPQLRDFARAILRQSDKPQS
jgi:hypothetical protein